MSEDRGIDFSGDARTFYGLGHGFKARQRHIRDADEVVSALIDAEIDQFFRYVHSLPPYSNNVWK